MEEEDATISRIITDLEETLNQNPTTPISHSTLQDLQSLLNTNDPDLIFRFFDQLPSKGLSVSSLIHPISSAMDGGPTNLSLLASKVYLSLLLSPNSPVFTLFTPMAFLSLLRSIRRALKRPQHGANGGTRLTVTRKRKRGEKARGSKDITRSLNEFNEEESEYDGRTLLIVLEKLESVMGLIYLNRFPDSLKSLIQMVAEIPVLSLEMGASFGGYSGLTDLCSRILSRLLRSEHGDMASTAAEVLKSLTPLILMGKSQARTFALGFLRGKMMGLAKESDGVKKAVMNLPKYLANKAQEKAEPRGLAVEAIMEIVKAMEFKDQVGFAEYTVKMCQGKPNLRLIAVDLILMLMMSLRDRLCVDSDGKVEDSWGLSCLEALIQRCSDSSAAIRARALSNLAQLVGEFMSNEKNREVLKKVMGFREGEMNTLLRIRCMDEKAAVRKAALMLVTKFTGLFGGSVDGVVLKTLGISCSDPLVSIRKAAISAISEAFRTFSDESVTAEWLHSVPCLITDNETSIQEECEKLFLELVLDRVSRAGSSGSTLHDSNVKEKSIEKEIKLLFPEGVLGLLKEICNGEVTPWVKKICTSLGKKKRLKPKIAIALQNVIRSSESIWLKHSMAIEKWTAPAGAWFLLSEVSAYLPKAVDWEFLHHHWQLLDKYEAGGDFKSPLASRDEQEDEEGIVSSSVSWAGDRVCLLQTISNVSVELPPEAAADLAHNLLKRIEGFNMHTTEVNAHVKALRTLCRQKALNATEADMLVLKWVHQLLSKASQILEKFISEISEANKDSSFFTPPRSGREGKKAMAVSRSLSEVVTAVYTIGSVVIVCPTADMSSIVPLLYTIITSGNSGPNLNKLPGPSVSIKQIAPSLYIQAWLTLGKLCLADGKLAKSYIPLFVQELEKSDCVALRNNIVVMMADFCVRYTALVDCYIAKITMCLRDSCELVRRQTFILLSRLLQRDYVKWRGVLFLRFLLSLVDESEKIRQLADYLFGNILKAKAPLLAYNSFVEAIFVLNDCHVHNGLNDSRGLQTEHRLFSIRGNDEKSRSKRMHIYVSLLKQMAPEHLLATFAKLCAEILAAASDGMLNIEDATGQSVLQDAFQILACKEIRITATRGSASDAGEIEEEAGDAGASSAAAKGRAITQAVRKGLIQNTIPIFIELKRLLESKNSPLSGSLMECLRILLKDYKNEIDDILVADRQLQKELTYDMQKYESAKAAAAVATSPALSKGHSSLAKNLQTDSRMASAMANAAAAATARSVLKEVNTQTPPLSAMSVPKLKTAQRGTAARNDRPLHVLESLRSRKSFDSDEEN
ncbi:condensin-2 complex subunit D3-like isoform X2 [Mangifera indica]|uniref:condensin-2 complex subunit D3-like isoform X2 n=1 Tax=Mangifera indica TaxID=29780 RepID=UPI001CF9E6E0|nr:condensin-2 complex subunit D3-like isoform X2 [Mangifera indica]